MDKAKRIALLKSQIQNISDSILDARDLLSSVQHLRIELERSKGWILGDLFGGGLFTRQSKYSSLNKIKSLIKDIKRQSLKVKTNIKPNSLKSANNSFLTFIDHFMNSSLVSWEQYQKNRTLAKDVASFYEQLNDHINVLEDEEMKYQETLSSLEK